ncbi:34263_t:CDS:2 [Gigaspora margarita]|uniref:34263_t:CDS:1 n=1 Tax=Gigaspora margarita TaxID=4874 RepID=A0ABN7ULC9_GIGMA|nr:34263_t:CDS:2 [Gigaspora margarita]
MLEGSWHLQGNGPTIISMLNSKLEKQNKQTHIDLGLFFIRQLLDRSGRNFLIWQQVKIAQDTNCKDKVPLWFRKLEELLIDSAESRKVKKDLFTNNINTSALQPHCKNVISDNRCKQWIWFTQKNMKKWHLGRVTKLLEKQEKWMHSNKNLIRGAAVGITKKENNWITNFSTILLKDRPEYHLTLVQKCPLLQIKEIDSAKRELVKSQNFMEKIKNLILENLEKI